MFNFFSEQNNCVEHIAEGRLGKVNVLTSKHQTEKKGLTFILNRFDFMQMYYTITAYLVYKIACFIT